MIVDYLDHQKLQLARSTEDFAAPQPPAAVLPPATPFFARSAVDSLSATSASFLTELASPLTSVSIPPAFKPFTISPLKNASRYSDLLAAPAASAREQQLLDALMESEGRDEARKRAMIDMQASTILAGMYVDQARAQLQGAEERKLKKKSRRKLGDGKAKYFTGDEFVQLCIDDAKQKEQEATGKEERRVQREAHAGEIVAWRKKNEEIRTRNDVKKEQFALDKAAWEVEKAEAKTEKRRPGWVKPKWKDYNAEGLLPRPKKPAEEEDEDDEDGEGSGNGSDIELD
ncbi:hypothetical protein C8R43DRAFT_887818 [Mycena crocata]|nr:hypothetical protein C8R43DRAFT_887818 [Mycena crocata]